MPDWVRRIAGRHMHDPVTIEVSTRPEIPEEVRQLYIRTSWADKVDTLCRILDQPDVTMALIFVETKRTADLLQVQIERRGYTIGVLHGDLSQKERDDAMRRFVATHVRSLIATNVAARGLDICLLYTSSATTRSRPWCRRRHCTACPRPPRPPSSAMASSPAW